MFTFLNFYFQVGSNFGRVLRGRQSGYGDCHQSKTSLSTLVLQAFDLFQRVRRKFQ